MRGNDVASFLMRPPVREEEVDLVEKGVTSCFQKALQILEEKGAGGLLKSGYISMIDVAHGKGLESDDEEENERIKKSIEEAVVRGNPRQYQIALFEKAKERNTIVNLGTGQGKTLIALLCIQHFSKPSYDEGKKTLFLVPSIALAVQHTTTLEANLPFKVATACHSSSNSDKAREDIQNCNILVATHGAALDILRHYGDYFSISCVNLIILDECHYATGNHGYARIMEMFYHKLPKSQRPRVLGLTASPLVNVRPETTQIKLEEMLSQLEIKLDSELACFSDLGLNTLNGEKKNEPNYGLKITSAEERVVQYFDGNPETKLPCHERVGLHYTRIKELNQLIILYQDYGPKVTGDYCKILVREVSRNRYEKESARQFERMLVHLTFLVDFCERECKVYPNDGRSHKLVVLEEILTDLVGRESCDENVGVVFVERRITALALHEYLRKKWKRTSSLKDGKPLLKCDMIVRQSTQVFKYLHPSHKLTLEAQQNENTEWLHQMKKVRDVLEGLRSKRTNVLIATSVVEEGVDVDACSFVIVLDGIKTSKGYVQMKGRARMKNAKFFVFENCHPDASCVAPITLIQAQEVEQLVRKIIESREPNIPDTFKTFASVLYTGTSASLEVKALHEGEYRAPKGCVEVRSAKSLLNRYSLSIPLDTSSRSSRQAMLLHMPIYDGYRLAMPAHLPSSVRMVILPEEFRNDCNSKEIQNRLALMACVRLHSLNLLNDRLLPLRRKDMHERLLKVALQKLPDVGDRPPHDGFPKDEDETKQVFLHKVKQSGSRFDAHNKFLQGGKKSIGILSIVPLIDIPNLTFEHIELNEVICEIEENEARILSKQDVDIITEFFGILMDCRWSKRTGYLRLRYAEDRKLKAVIPPYIVALLNEEGDFDWDRMKATIHDFHKSQDERIESVRVVPTLDHFVPRLWVPIYEPNNTYIAVDKSEIDCAAKFPHRDEYESYASYFEMKHEQKISDINAPLYAVQRLWHNPRKMHREKWVFSNRKRKANEIDEDITMVGDELKEGEQAPLDGLPSALLPCELCMEAMLPDAALNLHAILLPQILYHIEQCLTTRSFVYYCKSRLPLLGSYMQKVKLFDILEMLTARSCSMSISYDRLEYLGDAVLKLMQTDALLGSKDLRKWVGYLHEGDLSTLRSAMGSNERLKEAAKSLGLDEFILTVPLGRGQWCPVSLEMCAKEGLTEEEEEKEKKRVMNNQFTPSSKVCADVMESILGMMFVEFGYEASVKVGEELGLSLPIDEAGSKKDSDSTSKFAKGRDLLDVSERFLNIKDFEKTELLKEALTHPSSIYEEVPCYQKLEWIGDAVLCLAMRNWVFETYPELEVAELVILESMLVCNETLAFLGFSEGLHRLMNHRDPSLPRRFEEFQRDIGKQGRGLWGTDPPKVLPDVVEALLGAAHEGCGRAAGQEAALHAMRFILDAIKVQLNSNDPTILREQVRTLMHPKQVIHELAGRYLQLRSWREAEFATQYPNCPVWRGMQWGLPNTQSNDYIGQVICQGVNVIAMSESTAHTAKNRVCAFAVAFFHRNAQLLENVQKISMSLARNEKEDTAPNQ